MEKSVKQNQSPTANQSNVELKKLVFMSWAKILYNQGIITFDECNKALSECKKITK